MAHALLLSTARRPRDFHFDEFARVTRAAAKDTFKVHALTDDPRAADVIIFFEPDDQCLARDVRSHPYARQYPDKTFLFDPSDRVIPFLPGIYASIERHRYDPSRVRSGFYPSVFDHDWIPCRPDAPPPKWLFSLVGDIRGIPVREAIAKLVHPRAFIRDTGDAPENADGHPAEFYERFHRDFGAVMTDSAFTLCPRGAGTSTFRVFETMKAGRVPVILSDDWVPPEGPAWPSFSLMIPERDVWRLPRLLEEREAVAPAMGALARREWELWCSEPVCFHRIVESCLAIQRSRRLPERLMRVAVLWQLLLPFNLRRKLIPGLRARYRRHRQDARLRSTRRQ
jgi:hypothetical protein